MTKLPEKSVTRFAIVDFKPFVKNTLRGFCTIVLPSGMAIHSCTLHEKDGKRWISFPAEKFTNKDGEVSYKRLIEFADRATADKFRDQALEAIDRYRLEQQQQSQPVGACAGKNKSPSPPPPSQKSSGPPRAEFPPWMDK